jgi:hypothetical protein
MNMIAIYMLSGTILSALIAVARDRSVIFWAVFGIVAGPIAVAIVMWLPSRKLMPIPGSLHPPIRSLADEINALDDMRQRGMITDDEFSQGKAQILAWPVTSPIPHALSPQRVITDGRRTWASYQSATRAAFADLAHRHELSVRWQDDIPFEVVATYPVQPGLSLQFTLALEKGAIHLWGEGWSFDGVEIGRPDLGLPHGVASALDALIEGTGRIVTRTAYSVPAPFQVSLQVFRDDRWQTILRRGWLPWPPLWRRNVWMNDNSKGRTDPG